jgi:hypothetical protein
MKWIPFADNSPTNAGGDVELFDYSWIDGSIILDRDVRCGTADAFGVNLVGGLVRFGRSARRPRRCRSGCG